MGRFDSSPSIFVQPSWHPSHEQHPQCPYRPRTRAPRSRLCGARRAHLVQALGLLAHLRGTPDADAALVTCPLPSADSWAEELALRCQLICEVAVQEGERHGNRAELWSVVARVLRGTRGGGARRWVGGAVTRAFVHVIGLVTVLQAHVQLHPTPTIHGNMPPVSTPPRRIGPELPSERFGR